MPHRIMVYWNGTTTDAGASRKDRLTHRFPARDPAPSTSIIAPSRQPGGVQPCASTSAAPNSRAPASCAVISTVPGVPARRRVATRNRA